MVFHLNQQKVLLDQGGCQERYVVLRLENQTVAVFPRTSNSTHSSHLLQCLWAGAPQLCAEHPSLRHLCPLSVLCHTVAFPRIATSTFGSAPTVPCLRQPCIPTASFPVGRASSFVKEDIPSYTELKASLGFCFMLFGFCLGIWRHYLPRPHAGLCSQCWEIVGDSCCFPYVRFFYLCLFYFVSLVTCTWGFYFCFLFCFCFFLLWGSSLHHLTIELAFFYW